MMQGDLLDIHAFGLQEIFRDAPYLLVISHSCDLAHPAEPFLEVLPCHQIETYNGNMTRGKNPRELHLCIEGLWFSVKAHEKQFLEKKEADDATVVFSEYSDLQALQNWLAARYRRQALPNCINDLFKQLSLQKLVAKYSRYLCGVWLSYEDIGKPEKSEDYQDFDTTIYVVFDSEYDPSFIQLPIFRDELQRKILTKKINQSNFTVHCISDREFTYREVLQNIFVNFEYLSNNEIE